MSQRADAPSVAPLAHPGGARVLIIDDEVEIGQAIRLGLARAQFLVEWAPTARKGIDLLALWHPDAVILDLALPDMDGITVCRQIRAWSGVPIVILSVRSGVHDIVTALEAGADDYLTKPFQMDELLARVRVALRHAARPTESTEGPLVVGPIVIDQERRQVLLEGHDIHMTPTEYAVLAYLARFAGRVVTHQTLLSAVWGPQATDALHTLRVCIARIREKIEVDPRQPRWLLTEPGIGYRLGHDPF